MNKNGTHTTCIKTRSINLLVSTKTPTFTYTLICQAYRCCETSENCTNNHFNQIHIPETSKAVAPLILTELTAIVSPGVVE